MTRDPPAGPSEDGRVKLVTARHRGAVRGGIMADAAGAGRPGRNRRLVPRFRDDRIYLGWQHAVVAPPPGPPPEPPALSPPARLERRWVAHQRRAEDRLNRLLIVIAGSAFVVALGVAGLAAAGPVRPLLAALVVAAFLFVAATAGYAWWQGERALRARIDAERRRLEGRRAERERAQVVRQIAHARRYLEWQDRTIAFDRQLQWYAVAVPDRLDRIDIVGGSPSGRSAVLTTAGLSRVLAGATLSVLDLADGELTGEFLTVARLLGRAGQVTVVPGGEVMHDLPGTLARLLHAGPPGARWRHAVVVCDADSLRDEVADRLSVACRTSLTCLMLCYRELSPRVADRLDREGGATVFLRLADPDAAGRASDLLGTAPTASLSTLTEAVGGALDAADGRQRGCGKPAVGDASSPDGAVPVMYPDVVATETSWGRVTARLLAERGTHARGGYPYRRLRLDASALQRLPATACVVAYRPSEAAGSKRIMLADANPAIPVLPRSTVAELDDVRGLAAAPSLVRRGRTS